MNAIDTHAQSKYIKLLIKGKNDIQSNQHQKNIFYINKNNIPKINTFDVTSNNSSYMICGDSQFKRKYLKDLNINHKTKLSQSQIVIDQNAPQQIFTARESNPIKQNHFHKTIYLGQTKRQTFLEKLHKTQKNIINRQIRSMNKFKETQKSWQKIEAHLKYCLPKSETVTFSSVNKLYVHQNPEKIQIINDMIPQYWKNSLRNNDKKLKSHLRGNKFRLQLAEQMLQTKSGTKKIQQCIPRIGAQRTQKQFFSSGKLTLKAKKLNESEGNQTMKDFHKEMLKTLNQTLRQRSLNRTLGQQNKKSKKINQYHKTIDVLNLDNFDLTQNLQQDQKQKYNFCKNLEKLEQIDNEIYIRSFNNRQKWLYQGLANLS